VKPAHDLFYLKGVEIRICWLKAGIDLHKKNHQIQKAPGKKMIFHEEAK
jgi:hypothetical protein